MNLKKNGADIGSPQGILLGNKRANNNAINKHKRQTTHVQTVQELKLMKQSLIKSTLEQLLTEEPNHKEQFTFEAF